MTFEPDWCEESGVDKTFLVSDYITLLLSHHNWQFKVIELAWKFTNDADNKKKLLQRNTFHYHKKGW